MNQTDKLLGCPFCGSAPEVRSRETTRDILAKRVAFISCCCGGYSSRAYQMGAGATEETALADAAKKWNTRSAL